MSDYPSYADAANGLRESIREAIEVTTPCLAGGEHKWLHDRMEIHQFGYLAPTAIHEWWVCSGCGVATRTDPKEFGE